MFHAPCQARIYLNPLIIIAAKQALLRGWSCTLQARMPAPCTLQAVRTRKLGGIVESAGVGRIDASWVRCTDDEPGPAPSAIGDPIRRGKRTDERIAAGRSDVDPDRRRSARQCDAARPDPHPRRLRGDADALGRAG